MRAGAALASVRQAVLGANPNVRLIEVTLPHLRRLCRWLGLPRANADFDFNALARYVLTDSSRYCPNEDYRAGPGSFDWRNPFTAYNCSWGFHYPALYPEAFPCHGEGRGALLAERTNSTTCPRQMLLLCGWNTLPDGRREVGALARCNIEGYGGMDRVKYGPAAARVLAQMPGARCPYPPGDAASTGEATGWEWWGRRPRGHHEACSAAARACAVSSACPSSRGRVCLKPFLPLSVAVVTAMVMGVRCSDQPTCKIGLRLGLGGASVSMPPLITVSVSTLHLDTACPTQPQT